MNRNRDGASALCTNLKKADATQGTRDGSRPEAKSARTEKEASTLEIQEAQPSARSAAPKQQREGPRTETPPPPPPHDATKQEPSRGGDERRRRRKKNLTLQVRMRGFGFLGFRLDADETREGMGRGNAG